MLLDNHAINTFDALEQKVGIVVSRFNHEIIEQLIQKAQETLAECKVTPENITIIKVPGAVEIPFALAQLARTKKYTALVALGSVIKGATPHFDYVCGQAQQGALRVSLDYNIPVGFGVQTVLNMEQAKERIHIAGEAVMAALELATIDYGQNG